MTADYQTRVAGGRQAYQRFWDGFSAVTATDVSGSPPSTVTATITYTTKAGQVTRERTTFGSSTTAACSRSLVDGDQPVLTGWAANGEAVSVDHARPYPAGRPRAILRPDVLRGRCNSEPAVTVRDPAAASGRWTW